jgi:hypothetical protein
MPAGFDFRNPFADKSHIQIYGFMAICIQIYGY